jgi:predicted DNA-binding protein with PD1-like motif
MDYKKFGDSIYVRFNRGDEIISGIMNICRKEKVLSATYSGIGCCSDIVVSSYIPEKDEFLEHKKSGVLELISLIGNISADNNDEIFHHTHAMFSFHDEKYNLATTGGHLLSAKVLYTAEIEIKPVQNGVIRRKQNELTGITVWDLK